MARFIFRTLLIVNLYHYAVANQKKMSFNFVNSGRQTLFFVLHRWEFSDDKYTPLESFSHSLIKILSTDLSIIFTSQQFVSINTTQ